MTSAGLFVFKFILFIISLGLFQRSLIRFTGRYKNVKQGILTGLLIVAMTLLFTL